MGHEHVDAVLDRSRQGGTHRLLLLVIAHHADQQGEWRIDQPTLQRKTLLSRRRVQQLLAELVETGELAVTPGDGRGHASTLRLLISPERAQPAAPFSAAKGEAHCALSAPKGAVDCALPAPPVPPFPPDPQIPLYPPENKETSGLRPLTGPQSAVLRAKLLLEEAGVPLPTPAQIGLWSKTLGGIEPLLELLRGLIQGGLANKREPLGYVHRVVIERAAHPEPARPPLRALKTRNPVLLAGSDEARRQLALQIIAKQGGKK